MVSHSRVIIAAALTFALCLGLATGQTSRSPALSRLAETSANPTKMDWILLNSRVAFLEKVLRDQLSVPLTPTQWRFNADKQQIQISVYADPSWLANRSVSTRNEAFEKRGLELCVGPVMAEQYEYLGALMGSEKPPADYCAVRFWTHALSDSKQLTVEEVAIYEKGGLRPQ